MAESPLESLLGPWNKLQGLFASAASSSVQLIVPELVQLNDMVYEVYRPPHQEQPEIEIIFFHGLQLTACRKPHITTWMSHDNSEFWPQSWLPQEFPKARILTVSYDSFAKRTKQKGRLDMYLTSENLLSELTSASTRVGEAQCPVVLVGHCLGGLLLKELCLHANMTLSEKRGDIRGLQGIHNFFNNLRGMFFYGTPHLGSFLLEKLPDCFNGALMAEIEILNASSARKNASFSDLRSRRKWLIYGMGETQATFLDVVGEYLHVVPEASSRANMDMYYSVNANHPDLCKPQGKQSSAFSFLQQFLRQIQEEYILLSGDEADAVSGRGYVVDFEGRAQEVIRMLAEPNAHTIFIVGLSGIGKTTLAQQVFHDISHTFAIKCFIRLDNFKSIAKSKEEVWGKIEITLKRQGQGSRYDHFNVPRYLKGQKVLMILDNVQSQSQLDALNREIWLEGSNSRLVVTTTESRLASPSSIFTVELLKKSESRALFHHYAFADRAIPNELRYWIEQVINRCGGFPLSLEILGRYLSVEDVNDQNLWKGVMVRLENAEEVACGPDYRLWARLRPCYDALQPSEQEMFLDAALVFFGWPLSFVEYVWNACRNSFSVAWTNLKRGFLVDENADGAIWMHELLRNLGRSIACPQSSRLDRWRRIGDGPFERDFIATHQGIMESRSLEIQMHDNEKLILRNTTLAQYVMLQYLILDGVEMTEGSVELPRSLVYLKWKGASFETCPVDFNVLQSLAVLDLQCCKAMRILPPSVVTRKKLKWLELEGCQSLTKLPEGLYELSDLEYLGLSMTGVKHISHKIGKLKKLRCFRAGRAHLAHVPDSIGRLQALTTLDISCTTVTALPEAIGNLKQLRILDAGSTLLSSLPESIGCLQSLETMYLNDTGMTTLPESLGNAVRLRRLTLNSTPLESLPDSICSLGSLEDLYLEDTRISTLPDAFGELESLRELYLEGSRIRSLPKTFNKLSNLSRLELTISTSLNDGTHSGSEALSTIPRSRDDLGCLLNVVLHLGGVGGHRGVKEEEETLTISSAFLSPRIPLHRIHSLRIAGEKFGESLLPNLFHGLKTLTSLWHLTLELFNNIETLPAELGTLTGLGWLDVVSCQKLQDLPDPLGLFKLTRLELVNLPMLRTLPEDVCRNLLSRRFFSLTVGNCGSLPCLSKSFGHTLALDGDSSAACSNSNPSMMDWSIAIETDSWRLLRCLLECCPGRRYDILFFVKHEEMETVMKKAVQWDGGWEEQCYWKVGTTLLRKLCLDFQAENTGLHGCFTPSVIWPSLSQSSNTRIYLMCLVDYDPYVVRVLVTDEDSDEGNSDEDTDRSEEDEDSERSEDNIEKAGEMWDQSSERSADASQSKPIE